MSNYSTYNEHQLLAHVAQGDQDQFRLLVVTYRPQLLTFLNTYTRSPERSEEVVQDVFMKIWHARESLNEINNLSAFLFTIAKNLALNAVRSHLREKVRRHKWAEEFGETYIIQPESIKDDPDPLEAAVAALPAQQQRVWLATRYEGKKLAEVADEMNLSLNTVKKYVRYAQDNITAHLIRQNGLLLVIALFWKK